MVEEGVEGIPLTAHPHIVIEGGQLFRNNPTHRADTVRAVFRIRVRIHLILGSCIRIRNASASKYKARSGSASTGKGGSLLVVHFGVLEGPNLGEKVNGRIRIRKKGRIRIRIKGKAGSASATLILADKDSDPYRTTQCKAK